MVNLEIKKLPESEVEIAGEIEADVFESFQGEAIKKLSAGIKIDGFRQGNVPEKILIEKVGEGAILETAAEIALQKIYPRILEENKIFAIGRPQITITKIARNNPLGFKIKTAVMPEIQLPDYKKIASNIGKIKEGGSEEEKARAQGERRIEILEKIAEAAKIDIPKIILEAEKKSGDEKNAEKRIKFNMVLGEIARLEKLEVPEEELNKETGKIMEHYKNSGPAGSGIDENRVKDYAYGILMNEKVFQFLESQQTG